jgi:hypothetical protein
MSAVGMFTTNSLVARIREFEYLVGLMAKPTIRGSLTQGMNTSANVMMFALPSRLTDVTKATGVGYKGLESDQDFFTKHHPHSL